MRVTLISLLVSFLLLSRTFAFEDPTPPAHPSPAEADVKKSVPRYGNPAFQRSTTSMVLDEIKGLEAQIANDLGELCHFAGTMEQQCPLPGPGDTQVEYFRGISHTMHGLLPVGAAFGKDPKVPLPEGQYFHEFHYRNGRLEWVVGHDAQGNRYVTDRLLYAGDKLVAKLSYGLNGHNFGDYAKWLNGKPALLCRVSADTRKVVSAEVLFWVLGDEDYSVRYVASGEPQKLMLQSIYISKRATLEFTDEGKLKSIDVYSPAQFK